MSAELLLLNQADQSLRDNQDHTNPDTIPKHFHACRICQTHLVYTTLQLQFLVSHLNHPGNHPDSIRYYNHNDQPHQDLHIGFAHRVSAVIFFPEFSAVVVAARQAYSH